jgi:hypothetical protein
MTQTMYAHVNKWIIIKKILNNNTDSWEKCAHLILHVRKTAGRIPPCGTRNHIMLTLSLGSILCTLSHNTFFVYPPTQKFE